MNSSVTPKEDGAAEPQPGFEDSLKGLEQAVAALESGSLDLDGSLAAYERGVALLRRCQALLEAAERKVTLLTGVDENGAPVGGPFVDGSEG